MYINRCWISSCYLEGYNAKSSNLTTLANPYHPIETWNARSWLAGYFTRCTEIEVENKKVKNEDKPNYDEF